MSRTRRLAPLEEVYAGDLAPLAELAYNLWWTWNPEATRLFESIDPNIWDRTEHNAVAILRALPAKRRGQLASDSGFLETLGRVHREFQAYMSGATWFGRNRGRSVQGHVAYLCMEFGLHESLPIYAGGLGILAGDHVKSASDLGVPLVGVGVLWRNGYVRQHIGRSGGQEDWFVDLSARDLPLRAATDRSGRAIRVKVPLLGDTVVALAWRLDVGRVPVYLLDTNLPENRPRVRRLSYRLYCNGREERLCQEILLGVGGLRLLQALRLPVAVYHLNEGHAVFASLDRVARLMRQQQMSRRDAVRAVASTSVFTIHTPVPAGNEVFDPALVERYFADHRQALGLDRRDFLALGRVDADDENEPFGLTQLALHLSKYRNGVSALHGGTARRLWQGIWPSRSVGRVPIGSITNGIHVRTWLEPRMGAVLDEYLGAGWELKQDRARAWHGVGKIPDHTLWDVHTLLKTELIEFVRDRLRAQLRRLTASAKRIKEVDSILDPDALTIGFARRFAPYKRAALIFSDIKRLDRILNSATRPVQVLFAGKAHPGDLGGGKLIAQIERYARSRRFRRRVVLIEDYTIEVARYLVAGVDVWLNNPQRPQEASGTSGMKPTLHGGLNLSILDGWWPEGFDGKNGWVIGTARDHAGTKADDRRDAASLYQKLEREIVPLYYSRGKDGLPTKWIERMKRSMSTIPPRFNADRMVKEYVAKYYVPAMRAAKKLGG